MLQKDEEIHRVTHFWFDSWPDHKTPANAHSLLCLAKDVESYRFRDIQRGSTSSWPYSPKPVKSEEIRHEHTDLLSPCPEAVSPPSLKEASPVLHFGRLEFKDDELEKDLRTSPKSDDADNLILLTQTEVSEAQEPLFKDLSLKMDKSICKIIPSVATDKLNSPTFYDRSLYSNDDVFQVGSLPQKSPVQSRLQLENFRSRSVEASVTCGLQKSDDIKTTTGEFFDFDKLTISTQDTTTTSTDESISSDERKKLSSVTSDHLPDSFEKKMYRGITCTSSPNWTSETSPNLTHSFDKSTSKLSVDSLSWGGLDSASPHPRSPRTQSSLESPVTQSSSESAGRRWPRSSASDSSKQWTRSSEDSPHWLEREEEQTPRDWLDRSPLFSWRWVYFFFQAIIDKCLLEKLFLGNYYPQNKVNINFIKSSFV